MAYGHKIKIVCFQQLNEHTKKEINIDSFDCGNQKINRYLKEKVFHDVNSNTFVYIDVGLDNIIAFVTLACSSIDVCDEQSFVFVEKVSAVEIKHFAISKEYQHMKYKSTSKETLGDILFDDIIERIYDLTNKGIKAGKIILSSNKSAISFFKKHSFKEFSTPSKFTPKDDGIPMYYDLFIET